jgi:hypothetical protein
MEEEIILTEEEVVLTQEEKEEEQVLSQERLKKLNEDYNIFNNEQIIKGLSQNFEKMMKKIAEPKNENLIISNFDKIIKNEELIKKLKKIMKILKPKKKLKILYENSK